MRINAVKMSNEANITKWLEINLHKIEYVYLIGTWQYGI